MFLPSLCAACVQPSIATGRSFPLRNLPQRVGGGGHPALVRAGCVQVFLEAAAAAERRLRTARLVDGQRDWWRARSTWRKPWPTSGSNSSRRVLHDAEEDRLASSNAEPACVQLPAPDEPHCAGCRQIVKGVSARLDQRSPV